MFVSSLSILVRSCQRAAKIASPTDKRSFSFNHMQNQGNAVEQTALPKIRIAPGSSRTISHCYKSSWLISSTPHLNDTHGTFASLRTYPTGPGQLWWTAQRAQGHGEEWWRNLSTKFSANLALSQAWRCPVTNTANILLSYLASGRSHASCQIGWKRKSKVENTTTWVSFGFAS